VTTLLSKADEAAAQGKVTPEVLQALEAEVSAQGNAVAEAKAVSSSLLPSRFLWGARTTMQRNHS
jgi:hypothetical protein